jgi:hypothetical protein
MSSVALAVDFSVIVVLVPPWAAPLSWFVADAVSVM